MNWQKILQKFPEANFLQSPNYQKVNEDLGCKTIVENFDDSGYALMIIRNAKRGRYLEIPCGPLINWQNKKLVKNSLEIIQKIAKKEHCVFVRMRPQLLATRENLNLLKNFGLKKSPMHLAAEHTVIIDLTKPEETLLSNMRRQTRYEVRRAAKLNIEVEKSSSEAIFKEFHQVQLETARRQNFIPPDLKTLMAERQNLDAEIYTAKTQDDEKIAYGLIIKDGLEAEYYEAASTELNRKLPGAYALLWQAIKDLKAAGFKRFNLWGIAPAGQPHHRYAGVTIFKTGFGGQIVEYVPAHDLIINKPKYAINLTVETIRKKKRRL